MMPIDTVPDLTEGAPREVRVLLADTHRKLVSIALRAGGVLDDHSAIHPITIHCVAGAGVLRVGPEEIPLVPGRLVPLDPGVVHAVRAAPAVALLVTMFRG